MRIASEGSVPPTPKRKSLDNIAAAHAVDFRNAEEEEAGKERHLELERYGDPRSSITIVGGSGPGGGPRQKVKVDDLEVWRQADILVAWEHCGGNKKGFVTSIDARKLLLMFGVNWKNACANIEPGCYWTFESIVDKLSLLLPTSRTVKQVWRLLEHTDKMENNTHRTGHLNQAKLRLRLSDHGMSEEELYVFLAPYSKDDETPVAYGKMYADCFPADPRTRLDRVLKAYARFVPDKEKDPGAGGLHFG